MWATATMPPMVTKPMTNSAAMIWPASTEIAPSEMTFRMYPPARNWYATMVVNAMMSAIAPNRRANFPYRASRMSPTVYCPKVRIFAATK